MKPFIGKQTSGQDIKIHYTKDNLVALCGVSGPFNRKTDFNTSTDILCMECLVEYEFNKKNEV